MIDPLASIPEAKLLKIVTGVYALVNTNTGEIYVGQSEDVYARWAQHRGRGTRIGLIGQATSEPGAETYFRCYLLEEVDDRAARAHAELKWAHRLGAYEKGKGYNIGGKNANPNL